MALSPSSALTSTHPEGFGLGLSSAPTSTHPEQPAPALSMAADHLTADPYPRSFFPMAHDRLMAMAAIRGASRHLPARLPANQPTY
jgi:hypothetical protein